MHRNYMCHHAFLKNIGAKDTHKVLFTKLIFVYYKDFTIGSITTSVTISTLAYYMMVSINVLKSNYVIT